MGYKIEVHEQIDNLPHRSTAIESVRIAAVMYAHQEAQRENVTRVEVWESGESLRDPWRRILLYELTACT